MSADERGDACECVIMADDWPDGAEECLDEDPHTGFKCSRPAGHEGPHAGCATNRHPVMAWPQDDDESGGDGQ